MSNDQYFSKIYELKFAIDKLDEDYWTLVAHDAASVQDTIEYNEKRARLVDSLEKAHKS